MSSPCALRTLIPHRLPTLVHSTISNAVFSKNRPIAVEAYNVKAKRRQLHLTEFIAGYIRDIEEKYMYQKLLYVYIGNFKISKKGYCNVL